MGNAIRWLQRTTLIGIITIASASFDEGGTPESFSSIQNNKSPDHDLSPMLAEYIWPTDAGRKLTSVFAEFRRSHFHGGIDISTGKETGFSVFAARDGYISRIVVGPTGYGKQLWIHHPDGFYTTYSHLRNFNRAIDSLVRKEQIRQERYPVVIDCRPGDYPVQRGTLIAFTGETGTGSPHLHFEIRDPEKEFVNPLLARSFSIADDSLPRFMRFAITPLGENSFVDNTFQSRVITFKHPLQGSSAVRETLHVFGTFGVAIDVRDRINESRFNSGVYSNSLYLDDSLVYSVQFDRAPSRDDYQVGLYYDFSLMSGEAGRFSKLYMDSRNRLPFIQTPNPQAGVIDTKRFHKGSHTLKIVSKDFWNNRSELSATVVFVDRPDFRQQSGSLIYNRNSRQGVTRRNSEPTITHYVHENYVRLLITAGNMFDAPPSITLRESTSTRTLEAIPVNRSQYTATFRPMTLYSGRRYLRAECKINGRSRTVFDDFDLYSVNPPRPLSLDDGRLQIQFDSSSFYSLSFFEVARTHDLRLSGRGYSLAPHNLVLNGGLTVRLKSFGSNPTEALYFRQSGSSWRLVSTTRDGAFLVEDLSRTLGEVAVMQDTKPPSVTRIVTPSRYSTRPHTISFSVRDNLSGVEYKELKLYIDNIFVVPEIDGEHRRVVNRLSEPLARGQHTLRIALKDRVGNNTDVRRTFVVR